ncbi:MAG: hypothetical protein GY859_09975 [Desulfobacterales bacterium]|nr:hypothetical protein [Desulfobacterales bacterium]
MLTITGFGQMPIFKRYYIADIPGLGWLAKFYTTHYLHYLFAILFIALVAYAIADYFLLRKRGAKISPAGYFKIALLAGLIFSGVFLVIRNLPSIVFPSGMIIAFDLVHLGLVMLLLFFSAYTLIARKEWLRQAS